MQSRADFQYFVFFPQQESGSLCCHKCSSSFKVGLEEISMQQVAFGGSLHPACGKKPLGFSRLAHRNRVRSLKKVVGVSRPQDEYLPAWLDDEKNTKTFVATSRESSTKIVHADRVWIVMYLLPQLLVQCFVVTLWNCEDEARKQKTKQNEKQQ